MALKAYSYTENESLDAGVHDKTMHDRERQLAAEFVKEHPCAEEFGDCPLCGSADTEVFSVIGDVIYARCEACWSLYVPITADVMTAYGNFKPLKILRTSDEYQNITAQKRAKVWQEQLFWISFRAARYLAPLSELNVIEIGGRYNAFRQIVTDICMSFDSYAGVNKAAETENPADIALFLGSVPTEPDLYQSFMQIKHSIKKDGLLFLDSRVSTGFDILTLGGKIDTIFPYEHIILPSPEALELVLNKAGYEVLEISTPGTMDIRYIADNVAKLDKNNLFARYLLEKADDSARSEFQRFLQKNAISSYAQIVARAKSE